MLEKTQESPKHSPALRKWLLASVVVLGVLMPQEVAGDSEANEALIAEFVQAIKDDNVNKVRLFLDEKGMTVKTSRSVAQTEEPLNEAMPDSIKVTKLLVERGADLCHRDWCDRTPLEEAESYSWHPPACEMAEYLRKIMQEKGIVCH
ncbi:MAG: hypothetical protein WCV72_03475 [Patescibacteria group bacterium]|jgi:hypothetical protein